MRKGLWLVLVFAGCLMCGAASAQEVPSYAEMLVQPSLPRAPVDIAVRLEDYTQEGTDIQEGEQGGERVLEWPQGEQGSLTFSVDVRAGGLYNLRVRYGQSDARSGLIERGLLINGQMPFAECDNFYFPKRFADALYPFARNEYGNDIMPGMAGLEDLTDILLWDREAFYAEPLLFPFREGRNTITFTGIRGALVLAGITLAAPRGIPSYADYSRENAQPQAAPLITLEAEAGALRSSKSIMLLSVSEPGVTPLEAGHKYLNTIGGSNWDAAGDYAQWRFSVEREGLYRIILRYKQDFSPAMASFRRVEIDGQTPYRELLAVPFAFGAGWRMKILGDDAPYLVRLSAGEHTLRLTSVNAPYRDVYQRVSAVVSGMKALDLVVRETIGTDSDVYRIWKLEKYIPGIAPDLGAMTREMEGALKQLGDIVGGQEALGSLTAALADLRRLSLDHNEIAKNTDSLNDIYTVFAGMLDAMTAQPLQLDKLYFAPPQAALPDSGAGFVPRVAYWFSDFLSSFLNTGEDLTAQPDEEAVTVWVQRSRDYVDMMQLLADRRYTSESGVKVKVSYCPPGSQVLVLANASGNQPDVVTGVDIALPFEFGMRGSLVNLGSLPGFDSLLSAIPPGARIPYYFSGEEYAVAEEVKVKVMFYRKDVLERLHVSLPTTWDEVTQVLSTLLQNNYSLFYPYGDYLTFFFQNGVDVYTKDGLGLAFTNEKGFAAFKQWTDLYLRYGLQAEMSSFYQHFRTGDVPLGLADIDQYMQFELAAPDISGRWGIALVPGTYSGEGVLNHWQAGTQTGAIMFRTTPAREEKAWDFLRWWLSTDTQAMFADDMESYYGAEFRWFSANTDVIKSQAWPDEARKVLLEQMAWYKQLPMLPGGSYMTSRELWNAWTRIVIDKGNYRTEIERAVEDIQLELSIKQRELGYVDDEGKALIPMSWLDIPAVAGKAE